MTASYTEMRFYSRPAILLLLLAVIAMVVFPGWFWKFAGWVPSSILARWALVMALIVVFAAGVSEAVNGSWRAILIDSRNRVSLSRLQFLSWSLLVISALFAFAMHNAGRDIDFAVEIPTQLLVAMGISTVSLVGSPAVLAAKRKREPDTEEALEAETRVAQTQDARLKQRKGDGRSPAAPSSVVVEYESLDDARWVQVFTGDETATAGHVDLGKMQMFFFTFVLLLTYGGDIVELLEAQEAIRAFPPISDGMNELLGLSHTGYLANKTVSHSREASPRVGAQAAAAGS